MGQNNTTMLLPEWLLLTTKSLVTLSVFGLLFAIWDTVRRFHDSIVTNRTLIALYVVMPLALLFGMVNIWMDPNISSGAWTIPFIDEIFLVGYYLECV